MNPQDLLSLVQRTTPRQLKAIFGLQEGGNELAFIRAIQPVWNIEPLFGGSQDYQWSEGSLAVLTGALGIITFTVPVSEEWHLKQAGGTKVAGAPNTGFIAIRPAGTTLPANMGYGPSMTSIDGGWTTGAPLIWPWGVSWDAPLVLRAGDVLQVGWGNGTGGTLTFYAGILRRVLTITS